MRRSRPLQDADCMLYDEERDFWTFAPERNDPWLNPYSPAFTQSFPVSIYVYRGTLFDAELDLADKWTPSVSSIWLLYAEMLYHVNKKSPTNQVSSKLSSNDKYSTMEKFVDILSRDITTTGNRYLAKYKPVKISVAASIDSKHRPLFLPDRTIKSPIGDLLSNHFASTPHKVFLCLACRPEEENPEGSLQPQSRKKGVPGGPR